MTFSTQSSVNLGTKPLAKRIFGAVFALFLTLCALPAAAQQFFVSDIRVEGLQRISSDIVFGSLPINVGDQIDRRDIAAATRSLFETGNFDDIQIGADNGVLVIILKERPSISTINIEGNKALKTEALLDGLGGAGLAEGKVFKRATLEGMKQELTRQYVSQGRYDAVIETDVTALPRNRVAVNIDIDEGSPASIKHINIIGNADYDDDELAELFTLKTTGWFSFITNNDKYAREKLKADLETLSSWYQDRGYLRFAIDSTQVAISPDLEEVYISINITEGEKYNIKNVELSGDLVVPEDDLRKYLLVQEGQTFSQALLTSTEELLTRRLGNEGYNFAEVTATPSIDDENNEVDLKFFIDPGKRTYVRRINFVGNTRTGDEVLRQEMRQMEGAPASSAKIDVSRVRLERLGYFKQAEVETERVPGSEDLIDVTYTVEEQSSGSLGASVGFSQDSGLLIGANIQQSNFLGSGKQIGVNLSRSDFVTNLSFSYLNPYYTEDGVSRGFNVFFRKSDFEEVNVASFTTDTYGASVNFGYPLSETQRINFNFGYTNTDITSGLRAVQEISSSPRLIPGIDTAFVEGNGGQETEIDISNLNPSVFLPRGEAGFLDENGSTFDNVNLTMSWRSSTLNRGRLATRGLSQSVALELALPGSDLEFFKATYNGQMFIPLKYGFTMRLRTELGYGDGFGGTTRLPFFEHFFSGGFSSVRGYRSNTLGPRSTNAQLYALDRALVDDGMGGLRLSDMLSYVIDPNTGRLIANTVGGEEDPFGGNVLIEGGMEMLFQLPFVKDHRSVRTAFFIDAGNVFDTDCRATQLNCFEPELSELRYSAGLGLTWITGFGPLTFSVARALNEGDFDETEFFQFSLGQGF